MSYLSAEELLAGGSITHDVEVPADVLSPGTEGKSWSGALKVRLRPLVLRDIQRVTKAAKDDNALLSVLMLKESIVEPALSFEQVHSLSAGLARFLLHQLNRVSGLVLEDDEMGEVVQAPLARACFILAREFGWSPQEVGDLTMGQVLLYLEMLRRGTAQAEVP